MCDVATGNCRSHSAATSIVSPLIYLTHSRPRLAPVPESLSVTHSDLDRMASCCSPLQFIITQDIRIQEGLLVLEPLANSVELLLRTGALARYYTNDMLKEKSLKP